MACAVIFHLHRGHFFCALIAAAAARFDRLGRQEAVQTQICMCVCASLRVRAQKHSTACVGAYLARELERNWIQLGSSNEWKPLAATDPRRKNVANILTAAQKRLTHPARHDSFACRLARAHTTLLSTVHGAGTDPRFPWRRGGHLAGRTVKSANKRVPGATAVRTIFRACSSIAQQNAE